MPTLTIRATGIEESYRYALQADAMPFYDDSIKMTIMLTRDTAAKMPVVAYAATHYAAARCNM